MIMIDLDQIEDYKLYYPKELIADIEDDHVKNAINSILDELNS